MTTDENSPETQQNNTPSGPSTEEMIDFSQLKHKAKQFWSSLKPRKDQTTTKDDDDISLDTQAIKMFFKQNGWWIIPVLCIIIALSASIYLRTMPLRLPITDDWAESAVHNYYKNQLTDTIQQQYPNLPPQNRDALVDKEWQKFLQENKEKLDTDIQQLSAQYKNQFRDENGVSYLLGIDPYHYFRQSQNVVKYGHPGTEIRDGKYWDTYRLAPVGDEAEWNFHNWFAAQWYTFLNLFGAIAPMTAFFFVGTIFSALSVIPAFFIGRRITTTNIGGFFTAFALAVSAFFVSRTTGESSDTDVYSVFFPILITWLFFEALGAKDRKHKLLWLTDAGIATGLFSFAWTGWWYVAGFISGTIALDSLYQLIVQRKAISHYVKTTLQQQAILFGAYIISSAMFVSIFVSAAQFKRVLLGPFQFLQLKAVGVTSYWPNIRTTVAELNVVSLTNVIEQLGGKLLFVLAVAGIMFTALRKNEHGQRDLKITFFLVLWFIASLFATTKGMRFILQVTPVFALALGSFLGTAWEYISRWTTKELKVDSSVTKIVTFIILGLLLIAPAKAGYTAAYQSVASMNDAWYDTLTKIKDQAAPNVIITSWWDFGHWFKAIADRPVTFDGGNQVSWGAYWVGRSLLTNNEKATVGIVRMLNCGQNSAFNALDSIFQDTPKEIDVLNKIVVQSKAEALKTLHQEGLTEEQAQSVLSFTHCDAPADYYITSEDMVSKAGVWGHFGSWDFRKAVIYQKTKDLSRDEAVHYLEQNFSMTAEQADKIYQGVQTTAADAWIAPWPGYITQGDDCTLEQENTLICTANTNQGEISVRIDLATMNAAFKSDNSQKITQPTSLVYADKLGITEKKFVGETLPISIMLIPNGAGYYTIIADPLLAASTFSKLFFYDGHGLNCFQKFDEKQQLTGAGKISTWTIDYNCHQENKIFFLPIEEVQAAHILIMTDKRTPEEALHIIEEIKKNVTVDNFAEYAKRFSEDGSKNNGGNLGWFKKGDMVPEFEAAAFALKKGQISDPIKTKFGYHLILLLDKRIQ